MQESIHQFGCGFAIVLFFVYIRSRCFVLFVCTYMSSMLNEDTEADVFSSSFLD